MNLKTIIGSGVLLALAVSLVGASVAQAYIPPSSYIVRKLTNYRGRYSALRMKSNVIGMSGEKPTGVHFKTVSVFEPRKRLLNTWAVDDAGKVLYFATRFLNETATPEKLGNQKLAYLIGSLLLEWEGQTLVNAVKTHGIPVMTEEELMELPDETARRASEKTSIRMRENTIAWVIGEKKGSQLWVKKDAFVPLSYMDPNWGPGVAVHFENHRSSRGLLFPRLIRLAHLSSGKGDLIREEFTEVLTNPTGGSGLKALPQGFTKLGEAADSSLRDLIERYFRALR